MHEGKGILVRASRTELFPDDWDPDTRICGMFNFNSLSRLSSRILPASVDISPLARCLL